MYIYISKQEILFYNFVRNYLMEEQQTDYLSTEQENQDFALKSKNRSVLKKKKKGNKNKNLSQKVTFGSYAFQVKLSLS